MDAASRFSLVQCALLALIFSSHQGLGQEASQECVCRQQTHSIDPPSTSNPIQAIAHWFGQWMASSNAQHATPCGHRSCYGGKCCEVEDRVIDRPAVEEPILEVPAAPPLPPSYQFTCQPLPEMEHSQQSRAVLDSFGTAQVMIPASVLVRLLVDHAKNETQLAMTRELLEERTMFLQQLRDMSDRNAQLQAQLALSQSHLDYYATANPAEGNLSRSSDLRSIHEDLSNIRKQIALMKRNQPVPFAPSSLGLEIDAGSASSPLGQKTIK